MHAYLDCFSGISGDMALGAMIDLGVSVKWLTDQLRRIPLSGFRLTTDGVTRHGIHARQVRVIVSDNPPSRCWTDIRRLLQDSPLPDSVKAASLAAFKRIAVAEAGIHQVPVADVHFHELGGVDALVDIVGTMLSIEALGIRSVTASEIALGQGTVTCRHGVIPVPSPATVAILKDIPVYGTGIENELTTPTGAALVATLAAEFGPLPPMMIQKTGYGAGTRDTGERANVLRVITGEKIAAHPAGDPPGASTETVMVIETTVDDMNPEIYGFVMERLFEDGAFDVCWVPVQMKKNRPGIQIQVICPTDRTDVILDRLLTETTALGVRYYPVRRKTVPRETAHKKTSFGTVAVKRIVTPAGTVRFIPEYEICRAIARKIDQPLPVIYATLTGEINKA